MGSKTPIRTLRATIVMAQTPVNRRDSSLPSRVVCIAMGGCRGKDTHMRARERASSVSEVGAVYTVRRDSEGRGRGLWGAGSAPVLDLVCGLHTVAL